MFFFAALFVAGFILTAFFGPKPKIENARASSLNDFSFPRAKEGDPVPRIYGTVKFQSPNTIYMGDFKTEAIKKKVKTGPFSSKKQTIGFKYFLGLDLAVCLGPKFTFRKMWYGKNLIWTGCIWSECVNRFNINLPEILGGKDRNGGLQGYVTFYCGDFNQPQDPYLISRIDENVPAYVGVAHIVFEQFYFGNSPSIEAISIEGSLFTNSLELPPSIHIMPNGYDANPIEVVYDLLVNDWGNLNIDNALPNVAQWREIAQVIYDEGNGVSLIVANSNQGSDVIKEVMRQINAMFYQDPSTGLIEIKLIRQDYDIEDLQVLTSSEITAVRDYTKKLWTETYNRVRIKYVDREKDYKKDSIAIQDDFANIRYQGRIRASEISMPGVYDGELANAIAARELANLNTTLFQCTIEFNRKGVRLLPGEPFVLSWPEYEIEAVVMRIRKFGLGSLKSGKITAFCVQDEFALDAIIYATPEIPVDTGGSYSPGQILSYTIFELPYWLSNLVELDTPAGYTRVASFAASPSGNSIDYTAYIDQPTDDVEALTQAPYSNYARLVNPIALFDGFVAGYLPTLEIDNLSDSTILLAGDSVSAKNGESLILINGEIFAYESFNDLGAGSYELTNVYRSILDSGWSAHDVDSAVWFIEDADNFWDAEVLPEEQQVYLLDRTVLGSLSEDQVSKITINPVGRAELPLPPDFVTLEDLRAVDDEYELSDIVTVKWLERNRLDNEIRFEDDTSDTPEVGTTYVLQVTRDGAVLSEDTAIATAEFELTLSHDGNLLILVYAERDSLRSFTAAPYPVKVIGTPLEIDGILVEFDTATVEFN